MRDYYGFDEVTLHPDGTVEFWDCFINGFVRTRHPSNKQLTHCPLRMRRRSGGTSRRIMRSYFRYGYRVKVLPGLWVNFSRSSASVRTQRAAQ